MSNISSVCLPSVDKLVQLRLSHDDTLRSTYFGTPVRQSLMVCLVSALARITMG